MAKSMIHVNCSAIFRGKSSYASVQHNLIWSHKLADNLSTRDLILLVNLITVICIKYQDHTCFNVYELLSAMDDVQVFIHIYVSVTPDDSAI